MGREMIIWLPLAMLIGALVSALISALVICANIDNSWSEEASLKTFVPAFLFFQYSSIIFSSILSYYFFCHVHSIKNKKELMCFSIAFSIIMFSVAISVASNASDLSVHVQKPATSTVPLAIAYSFLGCIAWSVFSVLLWRDRKGESSATLENGGNLAGHEKITMSSSLDDKQVFKLPSSQSQSKEVLSSSPGATQSEIKLETINIELGENTLENFQELIETALKEKEDTNIKPMMRKSSKSLEIEIRPASPTSSKSLYTINELPIAAKEFNSALSNCSNANPLKNEEGQEMIYLDNISIDSSKKAIKSIQSQNDADEFGKDLANFPINENTITRISSESPSINNENLNITQNDFTMEKIFGKFTLHEQGGEQENVMNRSLSLNLSKNNSAIMKDTLNEWYFESRTKRHSVDAVISK